ncbi:MAG TPA: 4-(cytidine 5'-diphospho)-2-C-methyl-D-erythritol kinase [Pseudonocardia sp.]
MVPPPVTVRVPAKINLHLAVGDLRADGYHELATVFHAVSLFDEVTVSATEEPGVEVYGEGAGGEVPADERNLAWKAVLALAGLAGREPDVRVVLRKTIPAAGGMAGGSADAAATLVALSALWRLDLPRDQLAGIAAELGSDVSFGLHGGTALGTGRGEQLVPVLTRHTYHWVVALHRSGLATPAAFAELDRLRAASGSPTVPARAGGVEPMLEALASGDPRQLALLLANDLQAAAVSLEPTLRRTLRAGVEAGALAGIVSGSGPTCAFLCSDQQAAVGVAAELAGVGVCRSVRVAQGPVPGARVVDDGVGPEGVPPVPPTLPPARA